MLDFDLAEIYQVETRALKQAVRRNIERFSDDFMFQHSLDYEKLSGDKQGLSSVRINRKEK